MLALWRRLIRIIRVSRKRAIASVVICQIRGGGVSDQLDLTVPTEHADFIVILGRVGATFVVIKS